MKPAILGARIRERRRKIGITQAELARRIEISPSYLNLIEKNKRGVAGALLGRLAVELGLQLEELDGAQERRLLVDLQEIAHEPELHSLGVEVERAGEFIGRFPGWARAVAALMHANHESAALTRVLTDRLSHDPFLGESVHRMRTKIAAVRSAADILANHDDIDANQINRFHRIIDEESRGLSEVGEALAAYFDKSVTPQQKLTPRDEVEALFDSNSNRFELIEAAAQTLATQVATQGPIDYDRALALVSSQMSDTIDAVLRAATQIETTLGESYAREALLHYSARALLAPIDAFVRTASQAQYDIEAIAQVFNVSIDTVCHRLTTLPVAKQVPQFGYVRANAAGTIIESRSLAGLEAPRYAASCPLWVLFRAQQSPNTLRLQRALFPSGARFVFLAYARKIGPAGFGQPDHYVTDMLTVSEADAAYTVYAPSSTVPLESVGVGCRSCPRDTCEHRVVDPLAGI